MITDIKRPCSAISYIQRDSRILVVWNQRFGSWTLPGGKVEEGESVEMAQTRELYEETGLLTKSRRLIYEGETASTHESDRGRYVYVFEVDPLQQQNGCLTMPPREMELGSPVTWITRDQLLKWSCYAPFYEKMFAAHPALGENLW